MVVEDKIRRGREFPRDRAKFVRNIASG